jgi:RNA polymerase sigma-70 factor, ECF subfamily
VAENLSSQAIEELVLQIRDGNEEAARIILAHIYPLVLKLVRSHRPKRTSEEDLCQMIFVRIFHRLSQWARKAPFEHWVSRIAINTCLNQIQYERIRPELRYADLSDEQVAVVDKLTATEADLPRKEDFVAYQLLDDLLSRLKPKDRLVITLMHLEERSVAEIQTLTGWSAISVKVRAFRARQKLKKLYAQLLPNRQNG